MSVTCGFYNSLNGDRRYDSLQLSRLFDGLIIDGVFASIGTAFAVKAAAGQTVNVGIGKAWFNATWTYNDAILPMEAPDAEVLLDRIDAIVIEVNAMESVRNNTIKFVMGTPSSAPVRPKLKDGGNVYQYPLCYIFRKSGSTQILQADITNMVGTPQTPFVTGMLRTVSLDELLGQWRGELDKFVANESAGVDEWVMNKEAELAAWLEQMKADLSVEQQLLDQWIASEQADFLAWYNQMKGQLGEDAAGNLQNEIDREEVRRILLAGFVDGRKEFSEDGSRITTVASDGRTLEKVFTEGFSVCTTILKSATGADVAKAVKTFDASGSVMETVVTFY